MFSAALVLENMYGARCLRMWSIVDRVFAAWRVDISDTGAVDRLALLRSNVANVITPRVHHKTETHSC